MTSSSDESRATDPVDEIWVEVALLVRPALAEQAAALLDRFIPSGLSTELPFEQGEEFGEATIPADGEARVSGFVPQADWPPLFSDYTHKAIDAD